jgi:hypothetical protein
MTKIEDKKDKLPKPPAPSANGNNGKKRPNVAEIDVKKAEPVNRVKLDKGKKAILNAAVSEELANCLTAMGTPTEVAKVLGISLSGVMHWIREGKKGAFNIRSKFYFKLYPYLETHYKTKGLPLGDVPIAYTYTPKELDDAADHKQNRESVKRLLIMLDDTAMNDNEVQLLIQAKSLLPQYRELNKAGAFKYMTVDHWLEQVMEDA